MLAVYIVIGLVSGVVVALAISRARFGVLGAMLAVYIAIGLVSGVVVALAISLARFVALGTCRLHIYAKATTRTRITARGTFLRHARDEANILNHELGGARLVEHHPIVSTTKTATFRTAALMSCISSVGIKLYHLLVDGHEGIPSTVAGSAWAA